MLTDDSRPFEERRERALRIGLEYLDVENGHVERIDEASGVHEIVASVGGPPELLPEGESLDRATTYCRRTVESASPLALSDAPNEGWADDPAYEEHGFDCYLGARITVDDEVYGTVCFVDDDSRSEGFAAAERAFVELLAVLLGREMEAERHRAALDERERELDERERELDQSEAKYESLVDAAPNAIVLFEADTLDIAEANRTAAELTGYEQRELASMNVADLYPADQADRYDDELDRFLHSGETTSTFSDGEQAQLVRADGTRFPIEISATPVELEGGEYVQAIVRDVTERRERQRELRLKNRAVDEAAIGITIADATSADDELVYVNDEFERLTGYSAEEVLGDNCRFLQGPGTDPDAVDTLRSAIEAGDSVRTELLNYRADGTPFWNEVAVTPVTDATGDVSHFVGFQRDVTARTRREHLNTVLNRVLRHNVRNAVGVITGLADVVATQGDSDVAELAERIADSGWDLADLSAKASVLDTIVHEETAVERRDVVPLVVDAVETVRSSHTGASVELTAPDSLDAVVTDRFSRAVSELVENAVVHGGPESTVEVTVDSAAGHPTITVTDDGPGLPESERAVLRSGQETKLEHGQGLGLWLVNWIVTDAGGRVTTTVEDGTTVTIHLNNSRNSEAATPVDANAGRQFD